MNEQLQHTEVLSPRATCEDCTHAIRDNKKHDEVVCVPHLKNMPSGNTDLCDLYSPKNKQVAEA